jgi:hypothetical protein
MRSGTLACSIAYSLAKNRAGSVLSVAWLLSSCNRSRRRDMGMRAGREAGVVVSDHNHFAELRPVVLLHQHLFAVAEPDARAAELAAYEHVVDGNERYQIAAAVGLVGHALDAEALDRAVNGKLRLLNDVAGAPDVGVNAVMPPEVRVLELARIRRSLRPQSWVMTYGFIGQ